MKYNLFQIAVTVLLITILGCKQQDYNFKLPKETPRLVLLGLLQDGIPLEISLGVTQQFGLDSINYNNSDALVILYENDRAIDTLQFYLNLPGNPSYNPRITNSYYRSGITLNLVEGNYYHLSASAEGYPDIYTEKAYYSPLLVLDSLCADIVMNQVYPEENGFVPVSVGLYGVKLKMTGSIASGDELWFHVTDNPLAAYRYPPFFSTIYDISIPFFLGQDKLEWEWMNDDIDNRDGVFFHDRNFVGFEVIRFPAAYVNFLNIISKQSEEVSGLNAANTSVPNNIENGYGYFTIAERHAKIYQF